MDTIKLWVFPASDFDGWCELVDNDRKKIADHNAYMAMIAAIQADQERQGRTVERVSMPVADMIRKLRDLDLDNTPDNRAMVLAREPAEWTE